MGWGGGLWGVIRPSWAAESKWQHFGGKINILNENIDFHQYTDIKLLSQI